MKKSITKLRCGFYYEQLNPDEQIAFRNIGGAVSRWEDKRIAPRIDSAKLDRVLHALIYDNPEFFYWNWEVAKKQQGEYICLCYFCSSFSETEKKLKTIRLARQRIIAACLVEKFENEKELLYRIYQILLKEVQYAGQELQKPDSSKWIYTLEGVLINKRAVCLGIALAFNYICEYFHIYSFLVTGEARMGGLDINHGWNMVEADKKKGHVDVTFAICHEEKGSNDNEDNQWFFLKDEELKKHYWSHNVYFRAE